MEIRELIIKCKQGNQQAEKELFFRFAGHVLTICRRYTSSEADAKDFMQECFIQVFNNIKKYVAEKGEFKGWLHQVCTNRILELLRKNRRNIKVIYFENLPEESDEPDFHWDQIIAEETLLRFIQSLPKGYREVLNLFVFEGLRHKEIAKLLNISESTSRSQYTRAKNLLKQKIKNNKGLRYERC